MQPHYATPPISGPGPPLAPSYRFLLLPKSNSACSSSNSSSTSNSSSLYRTPARGPPFNSDIVVSPSSSSSTSPIDHYLQPELDEPSSHPDPDPDPDLDPPAPKKEPRKRRRLRTEEPRDMERRRHGCPECGKVFARCVVFVVLRLIGGRELSFGSFVGLFA